MSKNIIGEDEVRKIAHLARLSLSNIEMAKFTKELAVILEFIGKLNEADTSEAEPTSHVISGISNVFREDVLRESLPVEKALQNAPQKIGDFFGVPKVIE